MGFSTKAKATMAGGLAISCFFLVVGIREIRKPAAAAAVQQATPATAPPPMMLPLAAATRDIAIGETITAPLIRTQAGNAGQNPNIAAPAEAIGKVAAKAIPANSLIDRAMLEGETKLAIRVPVGMRALSIDTTAEIAVAGLVRPGDRVDVQVVYPGQDAISGTRGVAIRSHAETLLQMVPVLAVGDLVLGTKSSADDKTNTANTAAPQSPARTVTLALTPEQVSTVSLAKNVGGLYLSLRNPTDEVMTAPVVTGPRPNPVAASPVHSTPIRRVARAAPRRTADSPIELVIGDQHETIQAGSGAK